MLGDLKKSFLNLSKGFQFNSNQNRWYGVGTGLARGWHGVGTGLVRGWYGVGMQLVRLSLLRWVDFAEAAHC